jgi:hypothetical protein
VFLDVIVAETVAIQRISHPMFTFIPRPCQRLRDTTWEVQSGAEPGLMAIGDLSGVSYRYRRQLLPTAV